MNPTPLIPATRLPATARTLGPAVVRYAIRPAFTLVELLVVMAIIAIVIALVVPALFGGRNAARKAAAMQQITQITNACAAFTNDERRAPGYFSARLMGRNDNLTRGISGMENLMLDLAGFKPNPNTSAPLVGPTNTPNEQISVDPQSMGVPGQGSKQYYVPDKKFYTPQISGTQQMGAQPHADVEGVTDQLPDVVDPWGTPLLVWTQDETYMIKPSVATSTYQFARLDSGNGSVGAKFYWAQNACFLTATTTGKKAIDQSSASMLGVVGTDRQVSLAGVLGSPNAPYRGQNLNAIPTIPLSGRAPIIVQSAGIDGCYLGKKDKGANQFGPPLVPPGAIHYQVNFAAADGTPYTDRNGKPTNIDVLADFDDLFSYGGN